MEQINFFGENKKINKKSIVLSASRMTDMPKFYPNQLIEEVEKRINKGIDIHTLVLWSKHPKSLISGNLYEYLLELRKRNIQLYYQCTITGMGGRKIGKNDGKEAFVLEPNVPKPYEAINDLKKVIELLDDPLRIKLRIDPIVRIKNKVTCEVFSNIVLVEEIIKETSKLGIKNYTFSFLEGGIHKKVDSRFDKYNWGILTPTLKEKENTYNWLKQKANIYNVNIEACCVPGLKESRCIDGYLLSELHDFQETVDLNEPRKRNLCACTNSIDIGGWPPKKCFSGCKYCYANAEL
ncbi:MAG: DUF1848 family protein [Clostridium sp.]|uniref:DUF1848 family protein n=1 Tax=Clostridium sp. TaxID=1506 RepID=UPI00290254DF|nr:DUF1848 family protein [Clostridium sp.]MDU2459774.1 DUF1848 family protein [Clostridium sp.]